MSALTLCSGSPLTAAVGERTSQARRGAGPRLAVPALSVLCRPGLSNVGSMTVRSRDPGSYWEIISRGSLRGRKVQASACLSQFQLA